MSKVRGSKSDVARKRTRTGPARMPVRNQVSSGGVLYRQGPEELGIALIGLKAGTVSSTREGT